MSDECLMKQETVISFYVVYQAVMRKFTSALKATVTGIVIIDVCNRWRDTIYMILFLTFDVIMCFVVVCLPLLHPHLVGKTHTQRTLEMFHRLHQVIQESKILVQLLGF